MKHWRNKMNSNQHYTTHASKYIQPQIDIVEISGVDIITVSIHHDEDQGEWDSQSNEW
jgi:hypothetical protein